jgi:hypothetical protein
MRVAALALAAGALCAAPAAASVPGADVRLTHDDGSNGGYISDYTLTTGNPYSDATLDECSQARGRQNEPSDAIDPRDTQVIVGSSNDYCGVYNDGEDEYGAPIPSGPIWLGYYRSENGGQSFVSSLMPGYPGDTSPFGARSQLRTASAGDPVLAWDLEGRVFLGTETSDDPAGTAKTFGDVGVATFENPAGPGGPTAQDGKEFKRAVVVDRGSSAPNLLGQFNDKTAIEVDRTGGACSGNVYFSYSRFTGNGGVAVEFTRSTDHGRTFTKPMKLSASIHDVQFPDISVTSNGHVYITFRQFESKRGHADDGVVIARSTDCGRTFSPPQVIQPFIHYDAQDVPGEEEGPATTGPDDPAGGESEEAADGTARDCGDFEAACQSGYTFFRQDSQVRSTADQRAAAGDETVYILYDATVPGTQVNTGTTYGSIEPGVGSQKAVYFFRYDGATGAQTKAKRVAPASRGHQLFPDLSIEGGPLHLLWWDSRNDACYSRKRPIGNCADRSLVPSLDVYATRSTNRGNSFAAATRVSDVTTDPNYEQFSDRTVPFAGDYLWVSAIGDTSFGTWTDWRDTVGGVDQREDEDPDNDTGTGDVHQCRDEVSPDLFTSDKCPRAGGLDQNIYGDKTP